MNFNMMDAIIFAINLILILLFILYISPDMKFYVRIRNEKRKRVKNLKAEMGGELL